MSAQGLLPLLLNGHDELSDRLSRPEQLPGLFVNLLGLAVLGMATHGIAVGIVAELLAKKATGLIVLGGHPVLWLPVALSLSLVGALGVCLPIFHFCSRIAGIDAPLRVVAAQALRASATGSVLLLGLLPIYVAVALATLLGVLHGSDGALGLGLALPFAVGLFGIRSVYLGFSHLARGQATARPGLLLGMVLCACLVYSAVAPVALYRLAGLFAGL